MSDLDRFVLDAGLLQAEGSLSEAARAALVANATGFFRSGGVLSWTDWREMSQATREAFCEARQAHLGEVIGTFVGLLRSGPPEKRRNPTAPENLGSPDEIEEALVADVVSEMALIARRS